MEPKVFDLAAYRAFNDRLAAKYPELAHQQAHRAVIVRLNDARRALRRRDAVGALALVLDVLEGQVER